MKSKIERVNEIFEGLTYSSMTDSIDEFIKARDQFEQGDVIFIYKSSEIKDVENILLSACVRRHNEYTSPSSEDYIVELYTTSYSVIYPHVPRTYLDIELYDILKGFKVPNDILITYKQIIEDLKE